MYHSLYCYEVVCIQAREQYRDFRLLNTTGFYLEHDLRHLKYVVIRCAPLPRRHRVHKVCACNFHRAEQESVIDLFQQGTEPLFLT